MSRTPFGVFRGQELVRGVLKMAFLLRFENLSEMAGISIREEINQISFESRKFVGRLGWRQGRRSIA